LNKQETTKIVGLAAAFWPNFHPSTDDDVLVVLIEAWHSLLGDFHFEAVVAQLQAVAADGEPFAPPPGVLRRRLIEACAPPVPGVDQAWREVLGEVSRVGMSGAPIWSHPAIADAVAGLGWRSICMSEAIDTLRAHFRHFYADAIERHRPDATPPAARAILDGLRQPELAPVRRVVLDNVVPMPEAIRSTVGQQVQ
jgi:hypothetical protein